MKFASLATVLSLTMMTFPIPLGQLHAETRKTVCQGEVVVGSIDSAVGDCSFLSDGDNQAIFKSCQMGDICTVEAIVEDRGGTPWIKKVVKAYKGNGVQQAQQAQSNIEQVKVWFRLFTTAQYCAQVKLEFTPEEVDAYLNAIKSSTAELNLSRPDIDSSWEDVQKWFVEQRRNILNREDCEAVRRGLMQVFPNAMKSTFQKNPF